MTKFRTYDYTIGRFMQIDPLADQGGQEGLTPYQYSFNNPILYNDPYGDCPDCFGILKSYASAAVTAVKAKYSRMIEPARAPAQRVLSNTSGSHAVPNSVSMDKTTRMAVNLTATKNDINTVKTVAKDVALEATKDTGEVLDQTGEIVSDVGVVAAPFTEGASLVLVPIGEGMSATGKTMKGAANLAQGNVEGAIEEGVGLATGAVTNSLTSGAMNALVKNEMIDNGTQKLINKVSLKTTESLTNKAVDVAAEDIDDE